jgi:UDP-glucose 4-epimerase
MKKILITGSAGYIGQHLVQLLKDKYEVHGVDHRWDAATFPLTKRKDIFDLDDYTTPYDVVVHLAAFVSVGESNEVPAEYYLNNIEGTARTLESVNYKNFIFASTGAASNPTSPYARSKLCAEEVVRQFAYNYTIFRFYNVIGSEYGINPTNPDGLMSALKKASKTGKFDLYGHDYNTEDGTATRDYIYVMDVCRAIERAIEEPTNKVEELGTGTPISVLKMIETYKKINGVDFYTVAKDRRTGDLEESFCNNISPLFNNSVTIEELLKDNTL